MESFNFACTSNATLSSQVNFPLCTIAHTPRLPEHCIEYAKVLVWPQEHPFGGKFTNNIMLCTSLHSLMIVHS